MLRPYDPCADIVEPPHGEAVIDPGCARITSEHTLKGPGGVEPVSACRRRTEAAAVIDRYSSS